MKRKPKPDFILPGHIGQQALVAAQIAMAILQQYKIDPHKSGRSTRKNEG